MIRVPSFFFFSFSFSWRCLKTWCLSCRALVFLSRSDSSACNMVTPAALPHSAVSTSPVVWAFCKPWDWTPGRLWGEKERNCRDQEAMCGGSPGLGPCAPDDQCRHSACKSKAALAEPRAVRIARGAQPGTFWLLTSKAQP